MEKYYFTFSLVGDLFDGGWVLIHAETQTKAIGKFIDRFGRKATNDKGYLRCAKIFPGSAFEQSPMYKFGINNKFCQGVIF